MAEFYVRNSLNYEKAVKFNITLRYFFVLEGSDSDYRWVLEIGTTYRDANGDPISSKKIHTISAANFDDVIEAGVAELCTQIDWSPLVRDKEAPFVSEVTPVDGSEVGINSSVFITLQEILPSAGIDLSNIKITLNNSMVDFDITSEVQIEGDPYEYKLRWDPTMRIRDTYD